MTRNAPVPPRPIWRVVLFDYILPVAAALAAVAITLALSACGAARPVGTPPLVVKVPVPQPCAGTRPVSPASLKARTPDWGDMDVRQKAAATGQWALELQGYGEKLDAATAACP